jgi:ubiquinone/menaquinone biosynthesis C-methylase UbiE
MDVLTALRPESDYSMAQLQAILAAWVLTSLVESKRKISTVNGTVAEADYEKSSIYALLYSLYRSVGMVRSERGERYEFTFNTWGYSWPREWNGGVNPTVAATDPERFGKNAYTGLFEFEPLRRYVDAREGRVHVVEMGCGTGAGANHICRKVLPNCTYEAIDMQQAAIETCRRRFVPSLAGRLVATRANCTQLPLADQQADIVVVCETHVTEVGGQVTPEDQQFFRSAQRILKPGGFLVWGNAIPDDTWAPCFGFLESLGVKLIEARDVTAQAVAAREEDRLRVAAYVEQLCDKFIGFKIPVLGGRRRRQAEFALKNFYRDPGTDLFEHMKRRSDTYKVVLLQKAEQRS